MPDRETTSDKPAFRRFHGALSLRQQPGETGATFPTGAQLIEIARQAGVDGLVPECIKCGQYSDTVEGLPLRPGAPHRSTRDHPRKDWSHLYQRSW